MAYKKEIKKLTKTKHYIHIVQQTDTMLIVGCFFEKKRAKRFIQFTEDESKFFINELEII